MLRQLTRAVCASNKTAQPCLRLAQCHRRSLSSRATLPCTRDLAAAFQELDYQNLENIVRTYNQMLPSVYKQEEAIRFTGDKFLTPLFDQPGYLHREALIDELIENSKAYLESLKSPSRIEKDFKQENSKPGKPGNLITQWLRRVDMNKHHMRTCQHAMEFGAPLVLDCSFEHTMRGRELPSYQRQVYECIRRNAYLRQPYSIHLCGMPDTSQLQSTAYGELASTLVNTTSRDYSEVFDKKDIIVLSPDAPLYMETYDSEKVYVIGGIVDLRIDKPYSYKKARALGVECRKLPIDVWVDWQSGCNKRLTFTSVLDMLAKMAERGDWAYAVETSLSSRFVNKAKKVLEDKQAKEAKTDLQHQKMVEATSKTLENELKNEYIKYMTGRASPATFRRKLKIARASGLVTDLGT